MTIFQTLQSSIWLKSFKCIFHYNVVSNSIIVLQKYLFELHAEKRFGFFFLEQEHIS